MRRLLLAALALPFMFSPAHAAQDTDFFIRVKANDGSFIGTSMGGARIIIRDKMTGDILMDGITRGGAGDAAKIMAAARGEKIVDDGTAGIQFSLDIFEPVPVTITATGPLAQPQNMSTVTEDFILVPGKDYTAGNGIVLELAGLMVDITGPVIGSTSENDIEKIVPLTAKISTLAGDQPDTAGHWPADRFEVEATIYKDAQFVISFPLKHLETPGDFLAHMKFPAAGTYRIVLTAFDRMTKQAGMDSTTLTVLEKP